MHQADVQNNQTEFVENEGLIAADFEARGRD